MRTALAESLLAKLMQWSTEEITIERPLLQALANFKYDSYQQFSAGIRFTESLIRWLSQFETNEERRIAYDFVKNQLVYISSEQLSYLVSIAFSENINTVLITKVARTLGTSPYNVNKITSSTDYRKKLQQSLFIALSDGARIDQFRRSSDISNEQVLPTYHISDSKIADLKKNTTTNGRFSTLFLIDDFTASGKSYFRKNEVAGKILVFLQELFNQKKMKYEAIVNFEEIEIHVLFYIATNHALEFLDNEIRSWESEQTIKFASSVSAIQIIQQDSGGTVSMDSPIITIAENYFDKSVVDGHYSKGKHGKPFLGFDECALSVVLNHNSPNNSLPLLWSPEDKTFVGLFPRITRHRE